ncbi:MAG: glycine/betaine transporter substrate-binding protein [Bradyrhizobium sp.]|nr:glycine/betaine transporter substrate-binding protein [Bradyrhizobium sp.]
MPKVDDLADFHGDPVASKLVLFVGGNYFFAMTPLVRAFEADHPEYKRHIYWETLPPGLFAKQIEAGGRVTFGNMTWTVKPDAYFSGLIKVNWLIDQDQLVGPDTPYVTNDLTIMVPKNNPAHLKNLSDLGKLGIRLAMPNPEFEGTARRIKIALAGTGGDALEKIVYDAKVKNGTAILTQIHHRQTPI